MTKNFHFTLKNIKKLPKFYPTKRQHYNPPPSKKLRKNKVPVHVYGRVHKNVHETYVYMRAQCFLGHQIYLLIHARILKTQKRYKPCKESPMGHHLDYLYPQKVA